MSGVAIFSSETFHSDIAQGKASGAYPWAIVGFWRFVFSLNQANHQVIFRLSADQGRDATLSGTQLGAARLFN
jgi:hypothetical protein